MNGYKIFIWFRRHTRDSALDKNLVMKNIIILGSTGSIGVNALKIIQANPDKYRCVGLAAGRNIALLLKQIEACLGYAS